MIAAPWYLLSIGIFVLLVGFFLAAIRKPPGGGQRMIDGNMSDDEILENLQDRRGGDPVSALVILAGGLMILVSIIWRILRLLF